MAAFQKGQQQLQTTEITTTTSSSSDIAYCNSMEKRKYENTHYCDLSNIEYDDDIMESKQHNKKRIAGSTTKDCYTQLSLGETYDGAIESGKYNNSCVSRHRVTSSSPKMIKKQPPTIAALLLMASKRNIIESNDGEGDGDSDGDTIAATGHISSTIHRIKRKNKTEAMKFFFSPKKR